MTTCRYSKFRSLSPYVALFSHALVERRNEMQTCIICIRWSWATNNIKHSYTVEYIIVILAKKVVPRNEQLDESALNQLLVHNSEPSDLDPSFASGQGRRCLHHWGLHSQLPLAVSHLPFQSPAKFFWARCHNWPPSTNMLLIGMRSTRPLTANALLATVRPASGIYHGNAIVCLVLRALSLFLRWGDRIGGSAGKAKTGYMSYSTLDAFSALGWMALLELSGWVSWTQSIASALKSWCWWIYSAARKAGFGSGQTLKKDLSPWTELSVRRCPCEWSLCWNCWTGLCSFLAATAAMGFPVLLPLATLVAISVKRAKCTASVKVTGRFPTSILRVFPLPTLSSNCLNMSLQNGGIYAVECSGGK